MESPSAEHHSPALVGSLHSLPTESLLDILGYLDRLEDGEHLRTANQRLTRLWCAHRNHLDLNGGRPYLTDDYRPCQPTALPRRVLPFRTLQAHYPRLKTVSLPPIYLTNVEKDIEKLVELVSDPHIRDLSIEIDWIDMSKVQEAIIDGLRLRHLTYGQNFTLIFQILYEGKIKPVIRLTYCRGIFELMGWTHVQISSIGLYIHTSLNSTNCLTITGADQIVINSDMMVDYPDVILKNYRKVKSIRVVLPGRKILSRQFKLGVDSVRGLINVGMTFPELTTLEIPVDIEVPLDQLEILFPNVQTFVPFQRYYYESKLQQLNDLQMDVEALRDRLSEGFK